MVYCHAWGNDRCVGGTPECDSHTGGSVCALAFDDDEWSFWDSGFGFPHWIGYKFTSALVIQKIRIKQWEMEWCQYFTIYGSNDTDHDDDWDLKDWTELHQVSTGIQWPWSNHEFANFTAYLYIRFVATGACSDPNYWGVCEIEMFECDPPPALLSGTVKENGVGVARIVRCHLRSTGDLLYQTTSNPDGTFELGAPDDTSELYVVALDDDAGDQYNALIYDRVKGILSP